MRMRKWNWIRDLPVVLSIRITETVLGVGRRTGDRGQTTAEYALVIVGAAAVALLVLAWATGTGRIGSLLDAIVDRVEAMVT